MSLIAQEVYLSWHELVHRPDCVRPSWTVDIREDEAHRSSYGGAVERHSCPNEDCEHSGSYPRTTVRVVCLSCHNAHVVSGESGSLHHTTTRTTGFGQLPRRAAGLYLWPGEPWFDEEPREWLVTRRKPARVLPPDVVGEICQGRGPRGGRQFTAAALPKASGSYGTGLLRWERAEEGFTSLSAAAKWIAAQAPEGDEAE